MPCNISGDAIKDHEQRSNATDRKGICRSWMTAATWNISMSNGRLTYGETFPECVEHT
jgi:hypothetical protein